MTDTLERPRAAVLSRRQRYQRWLRIHQRHATRDSVIALAVCAVVVLALQAAYAPNDVPAPPADNPAPDHGTDALISMAMVGDIMFGRHVQEVTEHRGAEALLSHVEGHLSGMDYVTGNLEQAVLRGDPALPEHEYEEADKLIHLWSGSEAVRALADAGFTILNLANNHAMDYGQRGLADTMTAIEQAGLAHVGAGADRVDAMDILYEDVGGLTVATLGFTDVYVEGFTAQPFRGGVLPAEPEVIGPMVREAADEADLVVAHVHWGEEYDWRPDARQIELGRTMAEEGVDIVIGHHPHVLMPVELHSDSVIFYSLGNFVFDQGWTRTRESVVAGYRLAPDGTATIELTPVYIREGGPRLLEGWTSRYRQARIFSQLTTRTEGWEREGEALRLEVDHSHVVPVGEDLGE